MTGPRQWTIPLIYPTLPLSLNDRRHRMEIWRATTQLRDRVRWMTRHLGIPRLEAVHVDMTWTPTTRRNRDQDNAVATLKPAIDGLRDYPAQTRGGHITRAAWVGVVPDDTPAHVAWSPPVILPANPDPFFTERLVLTITERTHG